MCSAGTAPCSFGSFVLYVNVSSEFFLSCLIFNFYDTFRHLMQLYKCPFLSLALHWKDNYNSSSATTNVITNANTHACYA